MIHTSFTIALRDRVATRVIVDGAELAQNTAMKIKKLSKKDSLWVLEGVKR
jgi:hypothetical protein